jgi:hypothetical protein
MELDWDTDMYRHRDRDMDIDTDRDRDMNRNMDWDMARDVPGHGQPDRRMDRDIGRTRINMNNEVLAISMSHKKSANYFMNMNISSVKELTAKINMT